MSRGLDHLVLATHDLAGAADAYRRLGFKVGVQNRHPWGTLNHIVQMPGTFLEVIGLEPGFVSPPPTEPVSQFAGFIGRYLTAGQGFAMLVLETADAAAEQARLTAANLAAPSTFRFERTGKWSDGTPVHVAFTLAFAQLPATPAAGLFFCQQHYPENFWQPALQIHDNTAIRVAAVTFVSADVARDAHLFERCVGIAAVRRADGTMAIDTGRGAIEIVGREQAAAVYGADALPAEPDTGSWVGARFRVADHAAARRCLAASGLPSAHIGPSLVVAARHMHGVALGFEL